MTQTFIVANGQGTTVATGINVKTLNAAKAFFRASTDEIRFVADIARPGNAFWFVAADQTRALELIAGEDIGPVVSARVIKDNIENRKSANAAARNAYDLNKAGPDARRVLHTKFGAGTVISEDAKAVTVLFDGQKKVMRLVPSAIQAA